MTKTIGKTIQHGPQTWRLHSDGSWSVLAFGSFPNQIAPGLVHRWIAVEKYRVPLAVITEGRAK